MYKTGDPQSLTHPRPPECDSRQAIKARPDHTDRVVSPSGGFFSINMQQVAQASDRPICNEVQQQVAPVCVTGTGPPGLGSGCTQPAVGGSGPLCLPTSSHLGQVVEKLQGHALVLGSGNHVNPDPPESAQSAQPANSTLQSDPSQKSDKPKSPRMAPRVSAMKQQGFSEAVAGRIEAP